MQQCDADQSKRGSPWTWQSAVVSAVKVIKQVSFTQVSDILSTGSPWGQVLHYTILSFLTAPYLLQEVGQFGDDSLDTALVVKAGRQGRHPLGSTAAGFEV